MVAALERRGIEGVPAVWDAADVDWTRFDLVVLRSAWDYAERRDVFLAWAEALPRVLNSPEVLRWNTDKHYLRDVAAAGVPVVPTCFLEPDDGFEPPSGRFVVKPAVSQGSRNAARYESDGANRAVEHVRKLQAAGRAVMVQPYLDRVDELGETALVYVGGAYSHSVRKGALLDVRRSPGQDLYLEEAIAPRAPSPAERAVAEAALASAPFDPASLLYARVDLVPAGDRTPLVLEIELAEPSLFLSFRAGAAGRLAHAIERSLHVRRTAHSQREGA